MTRLLRLDASIRRDVMAWRAEQATQGRAMMTLITINRVYYLIGFVVMLLVVMTLRDRESEAFHHRAVLVLFGGIFLFGDLMVQELGKSLAYRIIGGVIVIALLAGFGLVGKGHYKMASEERVASSNRLKTGCSCRADDPGGDGARDAVPEGRVDWRRLSSRSETAHPGGAVRGLRRRSSPAGG
jgi:uncharacterized membrane protein YgdD (TMEM256/DUF423 family)